MPDRSFKNFFFFLIVLPGIFLSQQAYENLAGVSSLVLWESIHFPKLQKFLEAEVTNLGVVTCAKKDKIAEYQRFNSPIDPRRRFSGVYNYSLLAIRGPIEIVPKLNEMEYVTKVHEGQSLYKTGKPENQYYYDPIGEEIYYFFENCFDNGEKIREMDKRDTFFGGEFYTLWEELRENQRQIIFPAIEEYKKAKWKIVSTGMIIPIYTIICWTLLVFWILHFRISWAYDDENPQMSKKELKTFKEKGMKYFERNKNIKFDGDFEKVKDQMKKNREDLDLDLD